MKSKYQNGKKLTAYEIHKREIKRDNIPSIDLLKRDPQKRINKETNELVTYIFLTHIKRHYYFDKNGKKKHVDQSIESFGREDILRKTRPGFVEELEERFESKISKADKIRYNNTNTIEENKPNESTEPNDTNESIINNAETAIIEKRKIPTLESVLEDLKTINPACASLNIGTAPLLHVYNDHLKLDEFFEKNKGRFKFDFKRAVKLLIISRIIKPASVRSEYSYNENLFGNFARGLDYHHFIKALQKVGKLKESLITHCNEIINTRIDRKFTILFADGTNFYVTSKLSSDEKYKRKVIDFLIDDMQNNPKSYEKDVKAIEFLNKSFNQLENNTDEILDNFKDLSTYEKKAIALYYFYTNMEECVKKIPQKNFLLMYGCSKENRIKPLVHMFLVVDELGIPVDFEVSSGNTVDVTTFPIVMESIMKKYNIQEKVIVVCDSGTNSKKNLEKLRDLGYGYIVVNHFSGRNTLHNLGKYLYSDDFVSFPDSNGRTEKIKKPLIEITRPIEKKVKKKDENGNNITETILVDTIRGTLESMPDNNKEFIKNDLILSLKLSHIGEDSGEFVSNYYRVIESIDKKGRKCYKYIVFNEDRFNKEISEFDKTYDNSKTLYLNNNSIERRPKKSERYYKAIKSESKNNYLDEDQYLLDSFRAGFKMYDVYIPDGMEPLSVQEVIAKYSLQITCENVFRSIKSVLEIRPMYVTCDESITGYVAICIAAEIISRYSVAYINLKNDFNYTINYETFIHAIRNTYVTALVDAKQNAIYIRTDASVVTTSNKTNTSIQNVIKNIVHEDTEYDNINRILGLSSVPSFCDSWEMGKRLNMSKQTSNQFAYNIIKVAQTKRMKDKAENRKIHK